MESRKHLTSPALENVPPSASSSSPLPQNLLIKQSPASSSQGSSPLTICGLPLHMTVEEYSNVCSSTAFGLNTSSSGFSEFGGFRGLGLPMLPANSQVGTYQEWWRPTEAHIKGSAAFFPPLLGFHPVFLSAFKNLHPVDLQSHTSVCAGVNGKVKGRRSSPSAENSSLNIGSFLTNEKKDQTKVNPSQSQKSINESMKLHGLISKTKEKKPIKRSSEAFSLNGCLSGSLSESSSDDEETSSDPDDMEDDEDEPSSDDSDSGKGSPVKRRVSRLTHTSERKKKRPCAAQESLCHSVPVTSSFQPQSRSRPPGLHRPTARFLQRFRATDEDNKQHISVIQPTGLALSNRPSAQSHRQACPLSYRSSPDPDPKKHIPTPHLSKHLNNLTSINQSPPPSSLKPLSSTKTKSPELSSSKKPSHKSKFLTAPSRNTHSVNGIRGSSSVLLNSFRLKKDSVKQASSAQPKNQSDKNMFLNGATHNAVQDVPLALVTKPHSQSIFLNKKPLLASTIHTCTMPINLSTGARERSGSSDSRPVSGSGILPKGESRTKPGSSCPPVDSPRSKESKFRSSKASNESSDDGEDSEGGDSGNSLSDSESNLESDGSEDHIREHVETDTEPDGTLKAAETSVSPLEFSPNFFPSSSLLNQQIAEPLVLSSKNLLNPVTNMGHLKKHDIPSSSVTSPATPGSERRRRVTDERVLQLPLKFGWQRETRIRTVAGRLQGEVVYFAPCGKRLGQYPDVMKYLIRNGINEISRENFSFSTKIKVGNFYEAREGPEGLQWFPLAEDEIAPSIKAMNGRRPCRKKSDVTEVKHPQPVNVGENNLQEVNDAKLLRKLEAREIARQAAQIKMVRKLEKQAKAQAAREAKKQQAIMAAEEKRKKREEMKIFKHQEKIKRIQRIRMEKELRAQQVLEEKRRRKEAAANARLLEAERRKKEKEIQRLQAVLLRQQELEMHRLEMERERRRQHMIIMKAVEAQKKAEEKERVRQEMKEKKRLNKQKKLELRKLELEKAKELKKPNEDMCLADLKPLPELSRIPGLILEGKTFSDCLMLLQFLHNFGKVLRLDSHLDMMTISNLQEGLLNIGDGILMVQDLLVSMLSAAVCDPGVPAGCKCKTLLGDHLTSVEINRDNVSEILQIYMESHSEETELAPLTVSLKTKAFQAHSPSQKAAILAFLVNELCCSKAVISAIDKKIDYMTSLRKDKWIVDGKLRKLRNVYAKNTDKRDSGVGGKDNRTFSASTVRNKCRRKDGDSEEEEDEEDDSEDQDNDEEEEESGGKKRKKAEICEEDEGAQSSSVNELDKQIERMCTIQSRIRRKLFDSSHALRSMMIGEDRYKRRYWVLPQCGGIFVEGSEEVKKEKVRQMESQVISVKKEQPEMSIPAQRPDCDTIETECPQNKDNLFLQHPGSLSGLSKLLEGAKMTQDSDISPPNTPLTGVPTSKSDPSYISRIDTTESSELCATQLRNNNWITHSPQSIIHYDQLSKILTEKSSKWFSLLPRSPCDGSSVTSSSSSPASSSSPQPIRTKPSSFFFFDPPATTSQNNTAGINSIQSPISQQAEDNGNRDLCLADGSSVNQSETTDPLSNKLPVELAKTQDHPQPLPIPEEMLHGWWRVSDMENLQNLVKTLHSRGIRERVLQKQIQKHMEHMTQLFPQNKDGSDVAELEMQEVSRESVEGWCVEERAMEVDVKLLRQVEALERKVISANLQVKGWMFREPQSDSENLVYHEHKHSASSVFKNQEEHSGSLTRRPNNPLDIAVIRLAELESNVERSSEDEVSGMKLWRKALHQVCSSAQLSLCIQQLQKSITWDRAVVKCCQLCRRRDDEELLVFCDRCGNGCHTYCHSTRITSEPDGGRFCPCCLAKESGQTPHSRKHHGQTAGAVLRCTEGKLNSKPSVTRECVSEEVASSSAVPKRCTKELKKRRGDDGPVSCTKKVKMPSDSSRELAVCRVLLAELEAHRDAWPFLTPVDHKAVPGYKKVIKKPMDFSTIKEKLTNNLYLNLETFTVDVNLVFDNCEKFNEDDSEIGQAGHSMRRFFDQRWTELLQ